MNGLEQQLNGSRRWHYLNRDHVVLATFGEQVITIITTSGLRLSVRGSRASIRRWEAQLVEDIDSNFVKIPIRDEVVLTG